MRLIGAYAVCLWHLFMVCKWCKSHVCERLHEYIQHTHTRSSRVIVLLELPHGLILVPPLSLSNRAWSCDDVSRVCICIVKVHKDGEDTFIFIIHRLLPWLPLFSVCRFLLCDLFPQRHTEILFQYFYCFTVKSYQLSTIYCVLSSNIWTFVFFCILFVFFFYYLLLSSVSFCLSLPLSRRLSPLSSEQQAVRKAWLGCRDHDSRHVRQVARLNAFQWRHVSGPLDAAWIRWKAAVTRGQWWTT